MLKLSDLIKAGNEKMEKTALSKPDLLIIITGGEMAYTRNDGVKIAPIGCLKD